jgi:NAD(P)-dependent dehydrogenase (short-subunit alcohol dehydrogenase family)
MGFSLPTYPLGDRTGAGFSDHRLGRGIGDQRCLECVAEGRLPASIATRAAKGCVAVITPSMMVEFAPQKVRVNAIAPAATMTDCV